MNETGPYIRVEKGWFTTTTTVYTGDPPIPVFQAPPPPPWYLRPLWHLLMAFAAGLLGGAVTRLF